MLSYNVNANPAVVPCEDPGCSAHRAAHRAASRAHAAHATVLGLHVACCGLPVAAALFASGALGFVGASAFEALARDLHHQLHHYELWILGVSVALVAVGGLAELAARRQGLRRFPAFFVVSLACLAINAALVVSHRLPFPSAQMAASASPMTAPPFEPAPQMDRSLSHGRHHAHDH